MFISFVVLFLVFELFVSRNFVQKEVCVCMCVCMYPYCEYVETCQRICFCLCRVWLCASTFVCYIR